MTNKINTKEQNENERYVKYYELQQCVGDAISKAMSDLSTKMDKRFDEVLVSTKGLVTQTQLELEKQKLESKINSDKAQINSRIDTEISAINSYNKKMFWVIVGIGITIVSAIVLNLMGYGK